LGLNKWAPLWKNQRVLYRSDNSTTVSILNRQGTMASDLLDLINQINQICLQHNIDLAAMHIPGSLNNLADALSRTHRNKDNSDWMTHKEIFNQAQQLSGRKFSIDGACDNLGHNSFTPNFCSLLNPFQNTLFVNEHIWCNPDYDCVELFLNHFLQCYHNHPSNISAVFMLPVWVEKKWWKSLKGAHVLKVFSAGSRLFTSPDWLKLKKSDGFFAYNKNLRIDRGPTKWDVAIVHFPICLPIFSGYKHGSIHNVTHHDETPRKTNSLPVLRGNPAHDKILLSRMRQSYVPGMQWNK